MGENPRDPIGRSLTGDVLEVGPGSDPFPTAPGARVVFADKRVPGGRDATWPELVGQPRGPDAHFDIDLDVDGLHGLADASFDAVIASHLIEHLANPIAALREFERVVRVGGRLVLIVPDRTRTFDASRPSTTYAHVREEFDRGVTVVDDDHILEFCSAVYSQPPIHPDEVREWHNPERLDAALFDLHRQRSIHVHCWTPEEFAALVAAAIADGLLRWRLLDLYVVDDFGDQPAIEFALVLERAGGESQPAELAREFGLDWRRILVTHPMRNPARVAAFDAALRRDLGAVTPDLAPRPRRLLPRLRRKSRTP